MGKVQPIGQRNAPRQAVRLLGRGAPDHFREKEARDRKELWREGEMKERWKIIMEKAIGFAAVGPTTDFNFERCRSQSC